MDYILILVVVLCVFVGVFAIVTIMNLSKSLSKAEKDFHESETENSLAEESLLESLMD